MLAGLVASLAGKGLELLAGAVAKRGTDFIKEKTGIDLSATETIGDDEANILREFQESNRPELLTYLTAKDNNAVERERLAFTDVADARARHSTSGGNTASNIFVIALSAYLTLFGTGYVLAVTFMEIQPANVRFADVCLGFILGTLVAAVISFWLGSTKNSHHKDETIARTLNG